MFIIFKKSSLAITLLLVLSIAFVSFYRSTSVFNVKKDLCIVIDPGHGGPDSGAVSDSNILEKDLNLKIALLLRDVYQNNDIKVVMTRETDISLHDDGTSENNRRKMSDLSNRKRIMDNCNADAFVSIHMNKFTIPKYKGAQVFYDAKNEKSRDMAISVQKSLKDNLQDNNIREAAKVNSNILIMKNTKIPAIIVECGFLSNPEECELLTQEEYQKKLSNAIAEGTLRYLETNTNSK